MVRVGLWIDDPVSNIKKTGYWNELVKHGVSTAAIMLEGMGNGFDPKYTISDLEAIRNHALSRDIEIVLTIWPQPDKAYLDELAAEIGPYLKAAGAAGLEVDVEGNWTTKQVKGFKNLDVAGDYLVSILSKVREDHDVRIEATTFPGHRENSTKADVAVHADRLLPQAYSVRNRSTGTVEWNATYGPGGMQEFTLSKALEVPGEQKLSCGLAAYDQTWPGKKPEDAMQAAWDAAMRYNPEEIRFWSSKWVIGIKKNGYASKFLLAKKGK